MQITIFSVWMTFVWCSIFIVLCYILRKRSVLLNLSSMTGIIILYLFCLIRLAARWNCHGRKWYPEAACIISCIRYSGVK